MSEWVTVSVITHQRRRKQKNSGEAVVKGVRVILLISLIFIDDVIISVIIDYHCTSHIVKHAFFTLHTPHATKGRCLMIFIVFGSTHLSRRGYNNNEYYYDRRKSAAAMAYLAAAAPTPLHIHECLCSLLFCSETLKRRQ